MEKFNGTSVLVKNVVSFSDVELNKAKNNVMFNLSVKIGREEVRYDGFFQLSEASAIMADCGNEWQKMGTKRQEIDQLWGKCDKKGVLTLAWFAPVYGEWRAYSAPLSEWRKVCAGMVLNTNKKADKVDKAPKTAPKTTTKNTGRNSSKADLSGIGELLKL